MRAPQGPPAQGLYDPRFEHDACGVAFVATLTGDAEPPHRRPGAHRAAQPRPPRRRRRRGQLRRRRGHPAPDPGRLPARGGRLRAPAAPRVRRGDRLLLRRRRRRGQGPPPRRGDRRRGGARRARLARGAGAGRGARRDGAQRDAGVRAGVRGRPRVPGVRDGAGAKGLLPAQAGGEGGRRVLPVALLADPRLQGHAHHRPARPLLPRPERRAARLRAGRRALAVLHQHLPELAAGAPVPVHRPQRRDQHRDGQPQLDAGPRGAARLRPDPGRPRAALPDLHAGGVGLGVVRRGARAAPPRRPLAPALGADDDPGGVGEPHRDGRRAARVLRVPLHTDGAVGRPGLRGVHRRLADRRGPRPQRPAPVALLGHRRRSRRARLRGRRARPRPRHHRPQGPAPAGPDVPRRHRREPDHRGRGDQDRAGRRAPVRRVAARRHRPPPRRPRARAHRAHARLGHPAAADLRVHRGGAPGPAHPDGEHRRGADRLDGHRLPDRGAERQAADALRLLQPALRPGDQPAARRDPRGAGHLARRQHRAGGQPARPDARLVPPGAAAVPRLLQRRPRQDPAHQPRRRHARLRHARRARPVRRRGWRRRHGGPTRRDLRGDLRRDRRGRPDHRALRPALHRGARPHPVAAADRCGAPPPGPREDPHPGGAPRRGRRRARGAPRRAAHRVRRRGGQPVPRDGVGRGPRPRRVLREGRAGGGRQAPDQGARQGRAQGDVEDGRLHGRVLHRRPDLRGDRPLDRRRRPLLHRHHLQARRHRPGRDRRGGRPPSRHGVPPRRHLAGPPRAGDRRGVPVAPRGRAAPLRPRHRLPAAARDAGGPLRHLQAVHGAGRPAVRAADDPARPVPLQGARTRGRARSTSTRSSPSSPSSSGSRPARCPTARSARRRTRRWRSR